MENVESVFPLSPIQQEILLRILQMPERDEYVEQICWTMDGEMDVEAFARAWQMAVDRHPILRTVFFWEGLEEPLQVVRRTARAEVREEDWRGAPAEQLERLRAEERSRVFDYSAAPLIRVMLLRTDEREYHVVWSYHHLLLDGWSASLCLRDVLTAYGALCEGQEPALEPVHPFGAYLGWLRRQDPTEAERFWRGALAGFPAATPVPVGRTGARSSEVGERYGIRMRMVSAEVAERLRAAGRSRRVTLNTLFQAAWGLVLGRYAGERDVVFGSVAAGRPASLPGSDAMLGAFISTIPTRVRMEPGARVATWLKELQAEQTEARRFEHTGLTRIQGWSEVPRGQRLFDTLLVFQNLPEVQFSGATVAGQQIRDLRRVTTEEGLGYGLLLEVTPGRELEQLFRYDEARFDADTVERMIDHLEVVLDALVTRPDGLVGEVALVDVGERAALVAECNATAADYPRTARIHDLIGALAAERGEEPAVVCGTRTLSYAEFDVQATRLAHHLRRLGVGPEVPVALVLDRSMELAVSVLAVLKAGGAFVPLDPGYPAERLAFVLADSAAPLVLTRSSFLDRLPETAATVVRVDALDLASEPTEPVESGAEAQNLAYAIYTSGSTGKPKAAGVSHRSLVAYSQAMRKDLGLRGDDRILQFASPGFDVLIEELFPAWTAGAAVVFPRGELLGSPAELMQVLAARGVTGLEVPTAYWHEWVRQMAEEGQRLPECVRFVIVGGERVLPERLRAWAEQGVALVHVYGLTETTCTTTTLHLGAGEDGSGRGNLPIGRAVENARVYVLDAEGNPAPTGVPGELYVGGEGVARGYLGRPELTAERYVPDAFSGEAGSRLYRTGDRVRWLSSGELEFLGRMDAQVKVRGYRIEPAEIESVLAEHGAVGEAAVVVREGAEGERKLVAYLVPAEGGEDAGISVAGLREYVAQQLPAYMVPSAFVVLKSLPLTRHGKLDRRALPDPELAALASGSRFEAPHTAAEAALARVWAEVLKREPIGVHDNFFELGGDSILGIQVVSRARKAGLQLTPRQLFEHPTLVALARVAGTAGAVRVEQGAVTGTVELTPIQRWFFAQEVPERGHWNMPLLLEVRRPLDATMLERAVAALLAHHDALRLRFEETEAGWRQWNAGVEEAVAFERVDLSQVLPESEAEAIEREGTRVQASLDLSRGPLFRAAYLDFGAERAGRLLLAAHHLVVDGVSWRVLVEDLATACAQLESDGRVQLPAKTSSYQTWARYVAEHARTGGFEAELPYWTDPSRAEAAPLPLDHAGGRSANTEATVRTISVALGREETGTLLQEVPRAYRTQANDLLLCALARTLVGWTGGRKVLVEMEGHGREELFEGVDLSRTVGWFTTLFPVLLEAGEDAPGAAIRAVKQGLREVPQRGIGYGALRYLGSKEAQEALAALPAPEVSFNYLGQVDSGAPGDALFGLSLESTGPSLADGARRTYLVEIDAMVEGGALRVRWRYSAAAHREETVRGVAERFLSELRELIAHCTDEEAGGCTPSDFPLAALDQAALDRIAGNGREVEDVYPLTPMQEGMLFHTLYAPGEGAYVGQFGYSISGELDADAFERAWRDGVGRHPALRSVFVWQGVERPVQVVRRQVELPFARHDWRDLSAGEREARMEGYLREDRTRGFDPAHAPLMRLALFRTGEAEHHLVWSFHQMTFDGWSLPLVLRDVVALYEAYTRGGDVRLVEARPYREYVAWLERQEPSAAERFWTDALAGFHTSTSLGIDRSARTLSGAEPRYGRREMFLGERETAALQDFARTHRLTLNTLVQGTWALLLSRYSGEEDVVFGATASGRPAGLEGVEEMVGLFINTLPVRVQLPGEAVVLEWLRGVQERQAVLREFEHTPLSQIQRWSGIAAGEQLFESMLVFENYPVDEALGRSQGDLRVTSRETLEQGNYPLAVAVIPGTGLTFRISHDRTRIDAEAVERLTGHLGTLLSTLVAAPRRRLAELSPLSPAERQQLLLAWNCTALEHPAHRCVHDLFTDQAARSPEAVALACADQRLTYAELEARANRLARHLRRLGIRPEARVGVCLQRGLDSVVALLAVFKAGGVYVPLDPTYPPERLRFVLEDADVFVLLTQQSLRASLSECSAEVVCLDAEAGRIAAEDSSALGIAIDPEHLAYVIYTSGSTGRPKGVRIEHASLVNLLTSTRHALGLGGNEVVPALASFAFDISLFELLSALLLGGTTRIVPAERVTDVPALLRELADSTTLHAVPALMRQIASEVRRSGGVPRLRRALVGGDEVPSDLLAEMQAAFPAADVHVLYGPTEGTILASSYPVPGTRVEGRPLGRPLGNVRLYVCDARGEPVPVGVPGELWIGGAGVARDYLGQAELTAERFVPDPFGGV
ncbi:MAG TPA: amino acid adenylation domain-containing protein, partial [Longimicrobiaceae bacterium]|nr:amino acid adenylation domain-containing protein [Longimicrobiaceae bacterium]